MLGQAQVGAEAGHEVPGGDEVHAGLQGLQDQLEAAADLLLGDAGHGADLWGRRRDGLGFRWNRPHRFMKGKMGLERARLTSFAIIIALLSSLA